MELILQIMFGNIGLHAEAVLPFLVGMTHPKKILYHFVYFSHFQSQIMRNKMETQL